MSTEIQIALEPGQGAVSQSISSDSLTNSFKHIAMLASSPEFRTVFAILDEISRQREEINIKEEELTKVRSELRDQEEKKGVAINEMFAANEAEKFKQKEIIAQVETMRKEIEEKENVITEQSEERESLRSEVKTLQSAYSREANKVARHIRDINVLQESLEERKATIDEMKTAGSNLKATLSSAKKKNKELEHEKTSLNETLQADRARLQKLESFTIKNSEVDEDSM